MPNKRIFIIHGWGGAANKEWFPWLKRELGNKDYNAVVPNMPNSEEPKIKEWVSYLAGLVGKPDKNLYFVGHSVGCQTILRYLETLKNRKVGGIVLVAPWLKLTGLETKEEKEIARPWLETPIDFDKVKKTTDKIAAIFSDNDPFVPLEENKRLFEEKLNAKIIVGCFRWYRKAVGGHWEKWFVDIPICADIWHKVEKCSVSTGSCPTSLCRGKPLCCESW